MCLMLYKKQPFEMVLINPGSAERPVAEILLILKSFLAGRSQVSKTVNPGFCCQSSRDHVLFV